MVGAATGELAIILILCAISLPTLQLSGFFKSRKVIGPPRVSPGESIFTLIGILVLSGSIALFVGIVAQRGAKLHGDHGLDLINGIIYAVGLGMMWFLTARLRPKGLKLLGLTPRNFFLAIPRAAIAVLAIFPLVYAASMLVQLFFELLHHPLPPPHPMLQQLEEYRNPFWLSLVVFEAVVLAPLTEETFFRGYIQTITTHLIKRDHPSAWPRWIGIIITSILFALAHGQPAFLLPLFVLAVGLGYVYERTGNLWVNIFIHGLFNAIQIALFTAGTGK